MAGVGGTASVDVLYDTLASATSAPESRAHTAALDVVVHYLRMICAWPEGRGPLARFLGEYFLPLSFAASGVPQLVYFGLGEHDNNVELFGLLADALGSIISCFKMLHLQKHAVTIMAVREILADFTPMERSLASQALPLNERCERQSATMLRRCIRTYSVLSVIGSFSMILAVIRNDPWYFVKAPRYMMETRPLFTFMVAISTIELYVAPVAVGVFDGLLIMLSLHLVCKCDVLVLMLRKTVRRDADEIGLQDAAEQWECLRLCAVYHQHIIRLHRASESFFCTIALCQMFYTFFGLGTPLFRMLDKTQEVDPQDIAYSAAYVMCPFLQLFTYCYSGDIVAKASTRLSLATYGSFHPSLSGKDTKLGRIQHMIVLRAQRPLFLTAGRFTNLTLKLFQDIMRRSYSLYSTVINMR
ncbi:uncharacterized protein LOC127750727 isoform X2 [Frankliniella occidentalis]|uniref:Odorant receptor n=1 Tax=Frankliniella occidentalis TaxID=133901 RepID=A0A9C6X4Q2_FRAOC|nr:uncharacterized protein LOC127750727 isoform X2 [Frankliniella occidentalis]